MHVYDVYIDISKTVIDYTQMGRQNVAIPFVSSDFSLILVESLESSLHILPPFVFPLHA